MTPGFVVHLRASPSAPDTPTKDEGDFSDQQCIEDVPVGRFGCNKG